MKQLLLYGCLPRRMLGLLGLLAGFRVGHPWGTPQASISVVTVPQLWQVSHNIRSPWGVFTFILRGRGRLVLEGYPPSGLLCASMQKGIKGW